MLDIPDLNVFTSAKVSCWFKGPDGEATKVFIIIIFSLVTCIVPGIIEAFSPTLHLAMYIYIFKKGAQRRDDLRGYVFEGLNVSRHLNIGFLIEFWRLGF